MTSTNATKTPVAPPPHGERDDDSEVGHARRLDHDGIGDPRHRGTPAQASPYPGEASAPPAAPSLAAAREQLDATVRAYPLAATAAATGVGIVLGGGLPRWTVRLGVGLVARMAIAKVVEPLVTPPPAAGHPQAQPQPHPPTTGGS